MLNKKPQLSAAANTINNYEIMLISVRNPLFIRIQDF